MSDTWDADLGARDGEFGERRLQRAVGDSLIRAATARIDDPHSPDAHREIVLDALMNVAPPVLP
jgi:hypothetical protein